MGNTRNKEFATEEELKNYITEEYVRPTYVSDIKNVLIWRKRWEQIGNILLFVSHISTFMAAVLSFSEFYFDVKYLSFAAGCVSLISVFLSKYSDFSFNRSSKLTNDANEILKSLGLNLIQNISDDNNKIIENPKETIQNDVKTDEHKNETVVDIN